MISHSAWLALVTSVFHSSVFSFEWENSCLYLDIAQPVDLAEHQESRLVPLRLFEIASEAVAPTVPSWNPHLFKLDDWYQLDRGVNMMNDSQWKTPYHVASNYPYSNGWAKQFLITAIEADIVDLLGLNSGKDTNLKFGNLSQNSPQSSLAPAKLSSHAWLKLTVSLLSQVSFLAITNQAKRNPWWAKPRRLTISMIWDSSVCRPRILRRALKLRGLCTNFNPQPD